MAAKGTEAARLNHEHRERCRAAHRRGALERYNRYLIEASLISNPDEHVIMARKSVIMLRKQVIDEMVEHGQLSREEAQQIS